MGVFSGPDVSESGLVLALDARNNKSHSSNRFISYGSGLVTENVTFSVQGSGTFQRVAAGTVISGYVVKTTDVVYSYVLGSDGCHYHGNTATIPAGVRATFSFDYLVTGATNYPSADFLANFENYGGGALSGSIATANNLQNVWQRRTFTSGPTSSAGTQAMFLYPGACGGRLADSGTLYFRNPKVEWTNVDTGDGNFSSMSNVTTWYDMSGNGNNGTLTNGPQYYNDGYLNFDGTNDYVNLNTSSFPSGSSLFSVNAFIKWNGDGTTTNDIIFSYGLDGSHNAVILWINNSAYPELQFGSDTGKVTSSSAISTGVWYNICATYSGSQTKIYVNSELKGTTTYSSGNISLSNGVNGNNGAIGRFISPYSSQVTSPAGYGTFNGSISNVQLYNRVLTAAEVQQNFNATRGRYGI